MKAQCMPLGAKLRSTLLSVLLPLFLFLAMVSGGSSAVAQDFVRGDVIGDGGIDIADTVRILIYLKGDNGLDCHDAADVNDDGVVNIVDPVYHLRFLFVTGAPMPPGPNVCGADPTPDGLDCTFSAVCP